MADGTVVIDTDLDTSGLDKEVKKLESLASKGLKGVSAALVGAGTALIGAAAASTAVGMNFEASMSQVAATMGLTAEEINNGSESFEMLEKAAKEAGSTTKFSATQSAEALNYLALAGYSAENSVEALPTVLNLAAAGGLDLAYASDLVTDSMSALGLEMTDLEGFTDQLAKTSQKSNTSVGQLGEAILTVGGTAKSLAGGTTELNTALGILADNGIKGAEGGTALRNVILSLSAPTDKASKLMESLGLEAYDAEGNLRPLNDTFEDLNGILGDMTQGEQTQVLNELFNKTDLKSVNALLANSGERFDELSSYIDNADGAAANMAETMENNLKGKLTVIGSSLEGLGIQVYEKLEGPLKKAAETAIKSLESLADNLANGELSNSVDRIAEGFGNLIEAVAEGVETWLPKILDALVWIMDNSGTIAAGIVAIATGMLAMNVANMIKGVVEAFKKLEGATALAKVQQLLLNSALWANPMGLIIGLVVGLVAGLVVLWNTNDGFRNALINAWEAIKDAGVAVWEWLVKFFTEDIPNAWNTVVEFFMGLPQWFSDFWEGIKLKFIEGWEAIWEWLSNAVSWYIETLINFWSTLPEKIGEILGFVLGTLIRWGMETWDYLSTNVPIWIEAVVKFFSELPGKIWTWLLDTINKISEWGTNVYNKAVETGSKFINSIIDYVKTLPEKVATWLKNTLNKVITWGIDLGVKAKEAGNELITKMVATVKTLPGKIKEIGKDVVRGLWDGITSMGAWISDKVSGFMSGIVTGAKKALGIHSPSRVFRDQVGKYMAQGVGVGFEEESEEVQKDIQSNLGDLTARMQMTIKKESADVSKKAQGVSQNTANGNTVTHNDNTVTLHIENFNNESEQDVEELADELAYLIRQKDIGYGGG